jgi:hypothetical protein
MPLQLAKYKVAVLGPKNPRYISDSTDYRKSMKLVILSQKNGGHRSRNTGEDVLNSIREKSSKFREEKGLCSSHWPKIFEFFVTR